MSGTVRTKAQLLAQFASGQPIEAIGPDDEQDLIATLFDLASGKIAPNIQTASYTFQLADAFRSTLMNVASPNNLTVPPNGTVPFPLGQLLTFWQLGAGLTTLVAGAGVTLQPATGVSLVMRGQRTSGFAYQYIINSWLVSGDFT